MSAISKIYKEYGESTGKQYLSLWYSTMIAMGGMKSVEHQKEYAVRAQQYIRKEYGEDFWNDYNTFFRDYNRSDALIKELLKNKAAFVIKYLTVDLVREIVEGASSKKPVQAPGNNRPASVSKPAAVPVPQQNRNIVERKVVKKRETDYKQEYKESAFQNNPFNVLNLKCDATRQDIAAAVDENEFVLGSEKCTVAQGALSNPSKRLTAELDWFPDINDVLSAFLRSCVNQNLVIPLTSLGGVSKINAMLFNLTLSSNLEADVLCDQVRTIDQDYCALCADSILQIINLLHEKARIGQVTLTDVERELGRKREDIARLLSELLRKLPEQQYVSSVTRVAEAVKDSQDNSGVIITDIIDQYEIWVRSELESRMKGIDSEIEKIKSSADSEEKTKVSIKKLIEDVKEWNTYAYPIEIRVGQTGIDNSEISNLAYKLRSLGLFLNNDKNQTDNAALLTSELKRVFAQLPEVAARLEKDDSDLRGIQQERQEQERIEKENCQADKVYSVDIIGQSYSIPPFCTCCMKPTTNQETLTFSSQTYRGRTTTTHTTRAQLPVCQDCLNHRSKHSGLVGAVRFWSAFIGALVTLFIMIFIKIEDFPAILIGCAVAVGLHLLQMAKRKTKALPEEHSSRLASAEILSFTQPMYSSLKNVFGADAGASIRFTFTNWKYAQLFQKANAGHASEVREGRRINSAKSTSYSDIDDSKVFSAFKTIGIFLLFAILIAAGNQHKDITSLVPNSPLAVQTVTSSPRSSTTKPSNTKKPTSSSSSKTTNPTKAPSTSTSSKTSSSSATEKAYSSSAGLYDKVYVDVSSLIPSVGIYTTYNNNSYSALSKLYSDYDYFVCECTTSTGKKVYVYISTSDYKKYFDSTVSTSVSNSTANMMNYSPAARIHGKVISSSSALDTLPTKIGSSTVIEFISVDIPKQKITLSDSNIDDYFDVTVEWVSGQGNKVKMKYSIKPKNSAYAQRSESSADITVKLKIEISTSKGASPFQTKDYTVVLKKNKKYTSSGNIDITLTKNNLSEVYWNYYVDSCSGTLGMQ